MAAAQEPMFSADLISPEVSAALPSGYSVRPLRRTDFALGFLDVLRVLTTVGDISEAAWAKRYDDMSAAKGTYYLLVILDGERIVGTGALIVERKFIHELGSVGHIEDIAVAKDQQGKKLGLRVIQALDYVAERVGCYKVCSLIQSLIACVHTLADNPGLLRSQRGLLRQVWIQARRARNVALLWQKVDVCFTCGPMLDSHSQTPINPHVDVLVIAPVRVYQASDEIP